MTTKEFTVHLKDQPGTLAELSQVLANRALNIIAFQAFPTTEGESTVRFVVDNPTAAKAVLDTQKPTYTESQALIMPTPGSSQEPTLQC
jgi:hypothetical protein